MEVNEDWLPQRSHQPDQAALSQERASLRHVNDKPRHTPTDYCGRDKAESAQEPPERPRSISRPACGFPEVQRDAVGAELSVVVQNLSHSASTIAHHPEVDNTLYR